MLARGTIPRGERGKEQGIFRSALPSVKRTVAARRATKKNENVGVGKRAFDCKEKGSTQVDEESKHRDAGDRNASKDGERGRVKTRLLKKKKRKGRF